MSDRILFVYSNLKVTLHPQDKPYHGFKLLCGETQASIRGSLLDLGEDATYVPEGKTEVRGQIWTTYDPNKIEELKEFAYPNGNVRLVKTSVTIVEDGGKKLIVPAVVFAAVSIPPDAKRLKSGFWAVRSLVRLRLGE